MYRDTLTHSTLPTCTRNGAAKSTPTVNGTGGTPQGGEGEDLIWGQYMGPIPWQGRGGWQGLVHYMCACWWGSIKKKRTCKRKVADVNMQVEISFAKHLQFQKVFLNFL